MKLYLSTPLNRFKYANKIKGFGSISYLTLCMLVNFSNFGHLLTFISKLMVSKKSLQNTIRASNSGDPDQVRHHVGPYLVLNCLQRLAADYTSRQRVLNTV